MKWTTDIPKQNGWYFMKTKHGHTEMAWVDGDYALYGQEEGGYVVDVGEKWAGPIPEPED